MPRVHTPTEVTYHPVGDDAARGLGVAGEEAHGVAGVHHQGLVPLHHREVVHHQEELTPIGEHLSIPSIGHQLVRELVYMLGAGSVVSREE